MEVFEVFENSDDSVKDKDFELADNENTDSSEEHDDINVKRKTFETKHARKTEMVIKRKKVSDHEDVYPIKYTDLFRYNKMGSVKIGLCKLCEEKNITTEIKMKLSNTKGLKYHLQKQHLQQYTHYFGQETKPSTSSGASTSQTLTSMFKSQSKSATYKEKNHQNSNRDEFNMKVVKFIATKYLPFNFFDDNNSQEFFEYINKDLSFPKRTALKARSLACFNEKQLAVLNILNKNESKISFTVDGWTSIGGKSYYGITAHFIDSTWKMISLVLDFLPSNGAHTGKDIAVTFFNCLKNYNIQKKVEGITVDNVSANTTFLQEFQLLMVNEGEGVEFNAENQHFRCFAHILNLGVQDILDCLKLKIDDTEDWEENEDQEENNDPPEQNPINKIRKVFKTIKKSEQWQNKLRSCCEANNTKYYQVAIDVSTRWNSTHDMLVLALKMKQALNSLCTVNISLNNYMLLNAEWEMIELVCGYLKSFKTLTNILCGESYPTLPFVIVGFNLVLDKLEKYIKKFTDKLNLSDMESNLLEAFKAGFSKLMKHYQKTNWVYCAVLILDPRHKLQAFGNSNWGKEMKDYSQHFFETIYKDQYCPALCTDGSQPSSHQFQGVEEISEKDGSDEDIDLQYVLTGKQMTTTTLTELENYYNSPQAPKKTDILIWWKEHAPIFPNLSKMARDLLSIPATSVPAERLFSRAGLTIRKHRNRLNAESARCLLCLNSWFTCSLKDKL